MMRFLLPILLLLFIGCDDDKTPKNKPPVAKITINTTTLNPSETLILSANASSDSDGQIIRYEWSENDVPFARDSEATWEAPNIEGEHILTLKVTDDDGATTSLNVKVTVNGIPNNAPIAIPQNITIDENTTKVIMLSGSDPEGSSLTYIVTSQPIHGILSGTAPNLTYTPIENYSGSDSFSFKVNDGSLTSAVTTINVIIRTLKSEDVIMILDPEQPNSTIILHDPNPTGAYYTYVHDDHVAAESTIVEMHTSGISNSFHFVGYDANERYQWNEFPRYVGKNIISWDGDFNEDFIVYVVLKYKLNGQNIQKDLVYGPHPTGYTNYTESFLYISLGASSKDGTWHHYRRDIVTDLHNFYPSAILEEVNGFAIRGSGRITNIKLSE